MVIILFIIDIFSKNCNSQTPFINMFTEPMSMTSGYFYGKQKENETKKIPSCSISRWLIT